ncbi:MAG: hypothetical protein FD124_2871 [Alphaproteobacteria bacterium]|nr:MAG: hypothetical protein FD160_2181 [Caulobacteraceae bacterium]TPW03807.1 MAG: hypothetical protein FD124_2871 [Alphaproteobacteria bacterium]
MLNGMNTARVFTFSDILEERLSAPARVAFAALGLFVVLAPAVELGSGLWPLSLASPLLLVIITVGASIGLPMFAAAIADVGTRWTFEPHALRIEFLAVAFARGHRLYRAQGATVEIVHDENAPVAAAHRLCVRDARGHRWFSPPFRTHAEAEAYRARVAAHLAAR